MLTLDCDIHIVIQDKAVHHHGIKDTLLTVGLILPCMVLHRAGMMIVSKHAGMMRQVVVMYRSSTTMVLMAISSYPKLVLGFQHYRKHVSGFRPFGS